MALQWEFDWRLISYMIGVFIFVGVAAVIFLSSFGLLFRIVILAVYSNNLQMLIANIFAKYPYDLSLWLTIGVPVAANGLLFGNLVLLHRWQRGLASQRFQAQLQPAPDSLQQRLSYLSQTAEVPTPSVKVLSTELPTAFTTGIRSTDAQITVTTGLIQKLNDDECKAVLAHELAHIKNWDTSLMTVMAIPVATAEAVWSLATTGTQQSAGGNHLKQDYSRGFEGVFLFIPRILAAVFWIVTRIAVAQFAQYRELAADRGAVAITGDPSALAAALDSMQGGRYKGTDLRASEIDAFGIRSVPGEELSWATGWQTPLDWLSSGPRSLLIDLMDFHPSMSGRLAQLRQLETADTSD